MSGRVCPASGSSPSQFSTHLDPEDTGGRACNGWGSRSPQAEFSDGKFLLWPSAIAYEIWLQNRLLVALSPIRALLFIPTHSQESNLPHTSLGNNNSDLLSTCDGPGTMQDDMFMQSAIDSSIG